MKAAEKEAEKLHRGQVKIATRAERGVELTLTAGDRGSGCRRGRLRFEIQRTSAKRKLLCNTRVGYWSRNAACSGRGV